MQPVPLDFSPIIDKLVFGGVIFAVLAVVAGLAALYVAHYGARAFLSMLMGKSEFEQDLDQAFYERNRRRKAQDAVFRQRLKRERSNRDYQSWKKRKGY